MAHRTRLAAAQPAAAPLELLLTCEHGGNLVPDRYAAMFTRRTRLLDSHRGWDPGALELAGHLAATLQAPLRFALVSRLVIDLNRSETDPGLLVGPTASLGAKDRADLVRRHYRPYRQAVERDAKAACARARLVHVSVHTFTPVLRGRRRAVDIGLLFDPARDIERRIVDALAHAIRAKLPRLRIRRNAPYRGTDDGLTTHLRTILPPDRYAGIELEVNQRFPRDRTSAGVRRWRCVQDGIAGAVLAAAAELSRP